MVTISSDEEDLLGLGEDEDDVDVKVPKSRAVKDTLFLPKMVPSSTLLAGRLSPRPQHTDKIKFTQLSARSYLVSWDGR